MTGPIGGTSGRHSGTSGTMTEGSSLSIDRRRTAVATKALTARPLPSLEQRIAAHKEEVARFRAEHGDPAEALDAFIRETFDRGALIRTYEEYMAGESLWEESAVDLSSDG
jgi:hypothetical protein